MSLNLRLNTTLLCRLVAPALLALLAGCQTGMHTLAECKVGDWNAIGHKDGQAGLVQNFKERQAFCSAYVKDKDAGSMEADYQSGWKQGNWDLWSEAGRNDGRMALPETQMDVRASAIPKQHAPLNRVAYESGWLTGNSAYWQDMGQRAGTDGKPLSEKAQSRANADAQHLRFDEAAYENGWKTGNLAFWSNAGFQDAHNGIPESQFNARAAAAKSAGVLVQSAAYHTAWNGEIPNYWKNLGTADAVSGRDFEMRNREARQNGLKVFEAEYRQSWEARLATYWSEAGNEDGYGHPFQLEERIANAARDGVFVIARTRDLYTRAWEVQNLRYCNVDDAFNRGRRNERMAIEVCREPQQSQVRRAYLAGQDYEAVAVKHKHALDEIDEYARKNTTLHQQLQQVEGVIRNNAANKQRPVNEETARQDKRLEHEHHDLEDQIEQNQRKLSEARRWEDQYNQQMQRIKRDIYLK
ncbi:MAG: DUF2799 domain-containing protein [Gallionella sp.]|nr:DUF2799 domain-containing protein [Gallionella sp.]MDD4946913.1 DUF2799 domain-containing protein [Gallionella sp.]